MGQTTQNHRQGFANLAVGNQVEIIKNHGITTSFRAQLTEQLHRMLHRCGGKSGVRQDASHVLIIRLEGIQTGSHREGIIVVVQPNPNRYMPTLVQPQQGRHRLAAAALGGHKNKAVLCRLIKTRQQAFPRRTDFRELGGGKFITQENGACFHFISLFLLYKNLILFLFSV